MKDRARWLLAALLLALLAPILSAPRSQAAAGHLQPRPGRIWVRFKEPHGSALRARAAALPDASLEKVVGELNAAVVRVPAGQEEPAARRLAGQPDVAYALPIGMAQALQWPNDERFSSQWALTTIGAPAAWDVVTGTSQVTIAMVDSGIDLSHPDLAGKLWTNPREIPGNGIDDDGNGIVDDVHGARFYEVCSNYECAIVGDGNVQDDYGHGTHISGIAAAATNNAIGVAGVAWGATLMPVKVLGADGQGPWDAVIDGILYAIQNGARIVNLSLGDTSPFPPLQEVVAYARERGVLVVAATGNSNGPLFYPAAYPEVMAVAATDISDQRASFSNYGPAVSVAAPGVSVLSTYLRGGYQWMSGTSMATPHVAGLAALIWTLHPDYSATQVRRTIELTAQDVNAATKPGPDEDIGWGRIDANRAVRQRIYWYQMPIIEPADAPPSSKPAQ